MAERNNRTIVEMGKCMMKQKSLPTSGLGEVVHTTIYILNRSPTLVLKDTTPYEAWYGVKQNISHLRIFGSTYFLYVPKVNRKNLDDKLIKCI